jgi:hypothetical protein
MALLRRCLLRITILQLLLAVAAIAQIWTGESQVHGVVTDLDGKPIEGAEVTLEFEQQPGVGPPSVATDSRGRWRIAGLAAGRWRLFIKARDFISAEGWVQAGGDPAGPVEVWMRPLAELTAAFAESASSVQRWLEKGNTLLEQGRYEAARAEYEKALSVLPRSSQPEVLRSLARTHYLEGDSLLTIRTLEWALVADREDLQSIRLYSVLMEQVGMSSVAERFLRELKQKSASELDALLGSYSAALPQPEVPSTLPPDLTEDEVREPLAGRRGSYRVRFLESSPLSSRELLLQRLGLELADVAAVDPAEGRYDLAGESFRVFVPDSYSPEADFGLLVWISPTPFGGFVAPEMGRAIEESRLIWVGPDRAGNGRARWYRYLLALDAVYNMRQLYSVDANRIFVAGYSGGGRVASGLAMLYSEVFRGGFSLFGCDYPERLPVPDKPGAHWPPGFPAPPNPVLQQVKADSRFVLLTGELDFNRAQTKITYVTMLEEGFEHVLYLQVPGASHYDLPAEDWLERGFRFLTSNSDP